MLFSELVREVQSLDLKEVRKNSYGYFEFVLRASDEGTLCPILERFFGAPFKPKNRAPTKQALFYSADYGGIQKHQIMYYAERDDWSTCALIWPWQNGELATVKIAQGKIKILKSGRKKIV